MSREQSPRQGEHGQRLIKLTSSFFAPTTPVRDPIIQCTQLPPISSLLESSPAAILTPAMDLDDASMPKTINPSQTFVQDSKLPTLSAARRNRSPPRNRSSTIPNHPVSTGVLRPSTRLIQHVSQPETSPQNNLNSYHSPNIDAQPVRNYLNVAPKAGNAFNMAAMKGAQTVVNIATVTPASTDSDLVMWEPKRLSDRDSNCLPHLEHNDPNGSVCRKLEALSGKRPNQLLKREAKKDKSSEESDLAASLDALAREHARSSIASPVFSFPNSVSTRYASQIAGDVHGHFDAHRPKIFEKNKFALDCERKTTAEPGNELDFLASVILSQDNSSHEECHKTSAGTQEVSVATHNVPDDSVHSMGVAQSSPGRDEGDDEPRSEASFIMDDTISGPGRSEAVKALGPVITVAGRPKKRGNSIPYLDKVTVSPQRATEISPSVQPSSPHMSALPQVSVNVSNFGSEIRKGGIGYKLKRGPKSKKQNKDRAMSHVQKVRRGEENPKKERIRVASPFNTRIDPSLAAIGESSKHCHNVDEKEHDVKPDRKSFLSSRSVCCGSSPNASTRSTKRTSLSGVAANQTGSEKTLGQRKRMARDETLPPAAKKRYHQNENHSSHRSKPSPEKTVTPCALANGELVQPEFESIAFRPDNQRVEQEENRFAQLRRKSPSSTNAPADAEVAASPPLLADMIIAAAKQSPPYVHNCEQCSAVFNRRFNLNKHIRNVHENIRNFPCTTCGELFLQKSHLSAHILAVHEKSRPFQCDLCSKSFSWIGVLRKHMQAIHKVTLQRKTTKSDRSKILKAINENTATINHVHPTPNQPDAASIPSATQKEIKTPDVGVVLRP